MLCKTIIRLVFLSLFLTGFVHAQQIDETIARELGLVRAPATGVQSDVFDVALNLNKQTELVFPEQGTLDIKVNDSEKFEFLNVNNSLFIRPLVEVKQSVIATFELTRSKRAVVLRLTTVSKNISDKPIVLEIQASLPVNNIISEQKTIPAVPGPSIKRRTEYDTYVKLVSFAARSAYAPDRLIDPPRGISRQKLDVSRKQLKKLIREKRLNVTPLSSYAYRGLHITVLQLENKGSADIVLVPELVRGSFIAKSFHHNVLSSSKRDQYSALYLVSQRSFNDIVAEL